MAGEAREGHIPPFRWYAETVHSWVITMRLLRILSLLLGLLGSIHALETGAMGMDIDPFYIRDQGPFSQVFGVPPAEGGKLVPARKLDIRLAFDLANSDSGAWLPQETLELDGETHRYTVALRYGLTDKVELGLDIPYIDFNGGILDGFMNDFHKTIGRSLAQKGAGKNRIVFSYARNGVTEIDSRSRTSGFGDLLLSVALPLHRGESVSSRSVAVRAALKLPTGDPDTLRGSGGTDFSMRIAANDGATLSAWRITLYAAGGVLLLGKGEVLKEQQRDFAGFGTVGFGWSPLDWLALKLQLDMHSAFYRDSDAVVLNSDVYQLAGGFSFALPRDTTLDFSMSDNIGSETSPDVTFHVDVRKRF
mgnify:CR=1 FL=1